MTDLTISEVEVIINDSPKKARVLIFSILAGLAVNFGIFTLLNSITLTKPQNPPPMFSVSVPPSNGPIGRNFTRPIADHSKVSVITSYAVSLHATFTPFPTPPNPGKLERPLDHEHDDMLIPCFVCTATWFRGVGL